jgi:hypothetical protein
MKACVMVALALVVSGFACPAHAIEMFTNFNYGTELGTRPYGIEVLSPVRYHAYPHGRWFQGSMPCGVPGGGPMGPAPVAPQAGSTRANIVAPAETTAQRSTRSIDDKWIRSSNFLPPAQGE